jgi:hypothetical protein
LRRVVEAFQGFVDLILMKKPRNLLFDDTGVGLFILHAG